MSLITKAHPVIPAKTLRSMNFYNIIICGTSKTRVLLH
jgi:hypothetical protein